MSDYKPGETFPRVQTAFPCGLRAARKMCECQLFPEVSGFFIRNNETPGPVDTFRGPPIFRRRIMAVRGNLRIRIKGYDHNLVDKAAEKIVETAKRTDAVISGPVPLPTEKEIVTVLRAVHKYKDSREQFEQRTHKRLIDIVRPSQKTIEALTGLELPAGVEIEIKL